jgi:hypothetical protein
VFKIHVDRERACGILLEGAWSAGGLEALGDRVLGCLSEQHYGGDNRFLWCKGVQGSMDSGVS